jgi:hypothetical protein
MDKVVTMILLLGDHAARSMRTFDLHLPQRADVSM